ncbi:hypothetical protein AB0K09_30680, partial [Streptomyces sp. NPDC049577]|uniref:hypothetical protein n=1 Tax=Streptomyces sp. NPDC049577 TaxID=3155153 RepID=UPI003414C554
MRAVPEVDGPAGQGQDDEPAREDRAETEPRQTARGLGGRRTADGLARGGGTHGLAGQRAFRGDSFAYRHALAHGGALPDSGPFAHSGSLACCR